jgi:DNA-binding NarL/FixJ family response regulator
MIRVAVADDTAAMRDLIVDILEASPEIEVVATADDAPMLLARIAETFPDVVVTDVRMPPTGTDEGIRVAEQLRQAHPGIGVVVLTQYPDPSFVARVFAGGRERRAYIMKERVNHQAQLVTAVKAVHAEQTWLDPKAERGSP